MKTCELCKQQIKFGKGSITLEDYSKGKFKVCSECYKKISKENKKQLDYIDGKLDVIGTLAAFSIGGVVGAIGYKTGSDWVLKHSQKKYGYTDKQMNDFSIDIFDMHIGMLDDSQHRAVIDKFEGKTNSRHYRKFIHGIS